jgi:hypothetical protein
MIWDYSSFKDIKFIYVIEPSRKVTTSLPQRFYWDRTPAWTEKERKTQNLTIITSNGKQSHLSLKGRYEGSKVVDQKATRV